MKPKIVTSFRPHGKWGDFLAAIIPAIWCLNILINSNFILRLTEWQNETSLFTIRIRAKQWYWVYKFELKNFSDILTIPKNIGFNKWLLNIFGDFQIAEDYLYILQLRSQNNWIKLYWKNILNNFNDIKKNCIILPQDQLNFEIVNKFQNNIIFLKYKKLNVIDYLCNNIKFKNRNIINSFYNNKNYYYFNFNPVLFYMNLLKLKKSIWKNKNFLNLNFFFFNKYNSNLKNFFFDRLYFYINFKKYIIFIKFIFFKNILKKKLINYFNILHFNFLESSRFIKREYGIDLPLRIIKYPFNLYSINNFKFINLFNFNFKNNENFFKYKILPYSNFFVIKQKKYTKKNTVSFNAKYIQYSYNTKKYANPSRYIYKLLLLCNNIFELNFDDPIILYNLIKKHKKQNKLIPINLAKRIIRTKKILVLPSHINITLITNSFDVIHSWFIPGLGVKIDCVPGRSTHHTFFIDNIGFYYGQCAEICGRYHHHMPIRICSLPFEHFLIWWFSFGLPKLLFINNQLQFNIYFFLKKYTW